MRARTTVSPPSPLSKTPIGRPSIGLNVSAGTRPRTHPRFGAPEERQVFPRNAGSGGSGGGGGPAEAVGDGGADAVLGGRHRQQDVEAAAVGLPQALVEALGVGGGAAGGRQRVDAGREAVDPPGGEDADALPAGEELSRPGGRGAGVEDLDPGLGGVVR